MTCLDHARFIPTHEGEEIVEILECLWKNLFITHCSIASESGRLLDITATLDHGDCVSLRGTLCLVLP